MWIIASFDIPTTPTGRKEYRICRKTLKSMDFIFCQKSVALRWYESTNRADTAQGKIQETISEGNLLLFCLPDCTFNHTKWCQGTQTVKLPTPPNNAIAL